MTLEVFGIRQCDTCRKTIKHLEAESIPFRFQDIRDEPLDAATVEGWLQALGADQLINRRSTTWRQLDEAQRQRAESDAAALLLEHPTLIKRPVVVRGSAVTVGFKPDQWAI